MRVDNEKKNDVVRNHHEKERWGEFTIRKSDGVRVHYQKKSDGVRVHHKKESDGVSVDHEKKSDEVRVDH